MLKIADTHCHPYLNKTKNQNKIIKDFFKNDGDFLVVVGIDKDTIEKAKKMANHHKNVFFTIGIHPCRVAEIDLKIAKNFLENTILQNKNKLVGIGETGIDLFYEKNNLHLQKDFFCMHIDLAKKYNLPLIIHNRKAKDLILKILIEKNFVNFVFHCYSEDLEFARKVLNFSPKSMISFSGIITFKNSLKVQEVAKSIDLKNILAETDSPYLTPVPFRGKQENEPIFTKFIIDKIAYLRNENPEYVYEQILKNSKEFFRIK